MRRFSVLLLSLLLTGIAYAHSCDSLYLVSLNAYDKGDYRASLDGISMVIRDCPSNPDYYRHQAECYELLHQEDSALMALNAAISIDSLYVAAWVKKATLSLNQMQYDEAVKSYRTVLQIVGEDVHTDLTLPYWQNLGVAYVLNGEYELAADALEQAMLCPSVGDDVYLNYAATLLYGGRSKDAEPYLEKLLQRYPKSVNVLVTSGYNNVFLRNYRKAMDYLDEALSINPHDPYALNNRGYAYYKQKKYDRALEDITASLQYDSENAHAYRNLALVYRKMGKTADMCQAVEKAIALNYRLMKKDEFETVLKACTKK